LLLLDAGIVIEISRHGLWDQVLERCEIRLSRTVVDDEALYWEDQSHTRHEIDLTPYLNSGSITVFSVPPGELARLRSQFDPVYFEKLDAGETESLAYLLKQPEECQICSADKIVYRVLGNLGRSEQGISLAEILEQIGLGRKLHDRFTRLFREKWTGKGFQEGLGGLGMRGQS